MVLAPALVDLGVLLALAVLIGLSFAYRYSLGAAIVAIASLIGSIRLPGFLGGGRVLGFAADELLKVDHAIRHALGRGISDMQAAWNEAVSWTAYAVHWMGKEIASLAHDTAQAVEGLRVTQVTNVYRKVNPGLAARVGALAAAVATLRRELTHTVSREAHWAKAKATAVEHAIALPDTSAIPKALPGIDALERWSAWARHDLRRLGRILTPAGIIGLVGATFFGGFGLGWLRCRGVGRVGRTLCGLTGLIEAAAIDALTVFAAFDLCWFASGMTRLAENIRPLMLDFVDVENALLGRCGGDKVKPIPLADISQTPVVDAIAL